MSDNPIKPYVITPQMMTHEIEPVAEIPMPVKHARLPCIVCGLDLVYDLPDKNDTTKTTEAMNVPYPEQPFVCAKCSWAAWETVNSAVRPTHLFDASEPTDEETMAVAQNQLDAKELFARTLINMARGGYLGNSMRRE